MKRTIMTTVCAWLLCLCHTYADEFVISDITVPQGGMSALTIGYNFDSTTEKVGFTLRLNLPTGLSLLTDEDGDLLYEKDETSIGKLNIVSAGDGNIAGTPSTKDATIKGTEGTLLKVWLRAEAGLEVGSTQTVTVTMAKFQEHVNGVVNDINIDDFSFIVTIGEPLAIIELDEDSEVAPVASDGNVNVHVQRTINANEWSTICLPFAMTAAQVNEAFGDNVELGDFSGYEFTAASGDNTVDHIKMKFDAVTAIEAHHPYIIKVTNPIEEFTVDGVTIDIDDETYPYVEKTNGKTKPNERKYGRFVGNYISNFNFYSAGIDDWGNTPLFLSGNEFWYASEDTQTMKAFRAYFVLQQEAPDMDPAAIRVDLSFNDGEATGISGVQGTEADGLYYNLNGQAVKSPAKGLYIRQGKKVIMK